MKHLRRDGRWSFRAGQLTQTWNPAGARFESLLMGRAEATYSLDADDMVHLHYRPSDGAERHLVGPAWIATRAQPKVRAALVAALAVNVVLPILGAIVGYFIAGAGGRGPGIGVGALTGFVLLLFLNPWVAAVVSARALRKKP